MAVIFLTLSNDLAAYANELAEHLDGRGYDVDIEPGDISFPESPAMSATREGVAHIVVVVQMLDHKLVDKWWAYGRSAGSATAVLFFVVEDLPHEVMFYAREKLCGVMMKTNGRIRELAAASDLTVNLVPPSLEGEKRRLQQLLSAPFERIANGEWRRGFEDCCKCLETCAREYFSDGVASGLIKTQTPKGRDNTPTKIEINRMSIGQLAARFSGMVVRTKKDDVLVSCLSRINPARIAVAHALRGDEAALRREIGPHIHAIFNTLKSII